MELNTYKKENKYLNLITRKLISGRYLWTLCCCIVFLILNLKGNIAPETTKEILLMTLVFYFTKNNSDNSKQSENNKDNMGE